MRDAVASTAMVANDPKRTLGLQNNSRWPKGLVDQSAVGSSPQRFRREVPVVGNLLFWLGIGAAQTAADEKEAKPADPRRRVIGAALGALLALLIAGALLLLLSTTD